MPSPLPSLSTDPWNFRALCNALKVEISQGNWSAVSDQLKDWSAEVRGTLENLADRQQLITFGMALLQSGDASECRGLAPVFRPACPEAIAPLHALLIDPDARFESRWFAGQILAKLHQADAMAVLVATIESPDEMTASIAIDTLSHFGQTEIELLAGELQRLSPADDATHSTLRRCLVRAIAQIRDPLVIAPLQSVTHDPDPAIRLLAIGALSAFDADEILPLLLEALHDTSAPVRKAALTSLGAKAQYQQCYRSTTAEASSTAINWLNVFQPLTLDLDLGVATQAVIAIGRLESDAAIDVLIGLLHNPLTPPSQVLATVRALLQNAQPSSITALLDACSLTASPHQQSITIEIIRGLGRLHGDTLVLDAATALVRWCDRYFGNPENLANLANQANQTNQTPPPLTAHDPVLLQTIAYSLGNLGQSIGRSWLECLSSDPRDRVRITASVALQKLNIPPCHD